MPAWVGACQTSFKGFSTRAIHAGQEPDPVTGAIIPPIYQTSTYVQESVAKTKGFDYSRTANPTRKALETCLASLEEGKYGLAFASGMAAISAITYLLKKGDHVVCSDDVYGGVYRLFQKILTDYGLKFTFVDATSITEIRNAITSKTRILWLESPTNPLLKIIDLQRTASLARKKRILVVVDNTFMSPCLQNPLKFGADIVVHSMTKYLGGHSDVVGGGIVTSNEEIYSRLKFIQNAVGGVPSPFDCWLVLRGIKTLEVRMERHCSNAQHIAEFLLRHPKIARVIYPGLKNHPQHILAGQQMRGYGGMVSFEVKGGLKAAKRVAESFKIISLGESLGGVESLLEHPALMTHASVPAEQRRKIGISDSLLRLSVGIEDLDDLLEDLKTGLAAA